MLFITTIILISCNNSNSDKSKKEPKKDCISESQAQQSVNKHLTKNLALIRASWGDCYSWKCNKSSNGWKVKAVLYPSGGGEDVQTYYVDCNGNVN